MGALSATAQASGQSVTCLSLRIIQQVSIYVVCDICHDNSCSLDETMPPEMDTRSQGGRGDEKQLRAIRRAIEIHQFGVHFDQCNTSL
jgi:hypothetical protein